MGRKSQKRPLSLLEMMIVILLITMITGVIGYNMKGSLDRGKVFKSRQGKEQLRELFCMAMTESGMTVQQMITNDAWKQQITQLHVAKDTQALFQDGWGAPWTIAAKPGDSYDFEITSGNESRY